MSAPQPRGSISGEGSQLFCVPSFLRLSSVETFLVSGLFREATTVIHVTTSSRFEQQCCMQMLQAAPSRHRCLRLSSSTVWRTSCLATERSHSGLNSSTEWWTLVRQRLLPTLQTVGIPRRLPQVQSFDKVDMAFAVRDHSRQRRTLLMFRVFLFLDRVK